MNKRIKKKLDNIRSGLFQPFFRKMAGWNEIEEQIDTLHYFLNNTVDITTLPKATGLLRKVQLVDTEVLRIVLQILKKNGIDCWLDYGTLLGAVRHKGFIPWDDDLDVAIKRSDFDKVIAILDNELPSCFEHGVTNLGHIWISIWKAGAILDICPVDSLSANTVNINKDNDEIINRMIKYRKFYNSHIRLNDDRLTLKRNEIVGCSNENNPLWYSNIEFNADYLLFDNATIFPLKEIEFENYIFLCPNNSDCYLKVQYGEDYFNLPKSGVLHHSGVDNRLYLNPQKYGTDMDKLLLELKEIQPI